MKDNWFVVNCLKYQSFPTFAWNLLALSLFEHVYKILGQEITWGAQWPSGWVLDSRSRVWASPASLALCPWARHINPSLVLVPPRKNRPYVTERLLMGRKESNQTNNLLNMLFWGVSWYYHTFSSDPIKGYKTFSCHEISTAHKN